MAKMLDFPIPKNPELAELAFAMAAFMQASNEINETLAALIAHQDKRIATLEAQMHSIRYKDDCA